MLDIASTTIANRQPIICSLSCQASRRLPNEGRELSFARGRRPSAPDVHVRDALPQVNNVPKRIPVGQERFLSERRTSLPDIDLDGESKWRLEVYDKIIDRFGRERTAVTGMPETYRARHALRDTGLALGLLPQIVGEIAKSFPHIRARDIRAALVELPELRQLAVHASSGRCGSPPRA